MFPPWNRRLPGTGLPPIPDAIAGAVRRQMRQRRAPDAVRAFGWADGVAVLDAGCAAKRAGLSRATGRWSAVQAPVRGA